MTKLLRFFVVAAMLLVAGGTIGAQTTLDHKVKKKETMYGIAREYGITVEQLVQANPGMEQPGYKLKKGDIIKIPVQGQPSGQPAPVSDLQTIRLGVMLPLHKVNNDGRRMIEYYRGILMACDSLKKEGISVDVNAWNLPEDGNVKALLNESEAAKCNIIIGPLYSKYVSALSEFCDNHNILLVIPFSINAPELYFNRNVFQVYQSPSELTETTARRCSEWFKDYHTVIVDCGDSTSTKGSFTSNLRRQLEVKDARYSLTSLKTKDENFSNAFVNDRRNLVILNTARSKDLLSVFARLKELKKNRPNVEISMFGYTEWMMYLQYQQENFHLFDVYIPAPFHTNLESTLAERLQQKYRWNFHQDMMQALPRFAFTGFDHAVFFIRGLRQYGLSFDGASGRVDCKPVQTPLKFERIGNGGFQNRSYMFIHYKPDHTIETINY